VAGVDTATYLYNAMGERVSRVLNSGSKTHFQYFNGKIMNEINPDVADVTKSSIREIIYLGDFPIAQIKTSSTTGVSTRY
jgi:hypothetical protein